MKGYEKLEAALDKIEALFKDDKFNGVFDMGDFGYHSGGHEPDEQNYCGTSACMAGWLVMVDPGYKEACGANWYGKKLDADRGFASSAAEYYGITHDPETGTGGMFDLFYANTNLRGPEGLERKMEEARRLVAEAREKDNG